MIFADFHAHPFLRPFQNRDNDADTISRNPNEVSSAWNEYDLPKDSLRHIIGEHAGFTTYSESDFTRAAKSSVRLIAVSVYPPESGFFEIPDSTTLHKIINFLRLEKGVEIELGHIVSSFSKKNIRSIKSDAYDYFQELLKQLKYLQATLPFTPDSSQCVGTIYSQIKNASFTILQNGSDIQLINSDPILQLFLNIEGGNSLWSNITLPDGQIWNGRNFNNHISNNELQSYKVLDVDDFRNAITKDIIEHNPSAMKQLWSKDVCDIVMQNLRTLIGGSTKIFSFTLSHHFYNGLCGHCDSLQPLTDLGLTDQSFGKDSDITHLGYLVINELLKNNILIDIKHMSWKARKSYYRFRDNNYPHIPVMWSHCAVSGRKVVGESSIDTWDPNPFYQEAVNLYDDDIFETIRSHGLIGIELDQRVNGVKDSTIDTLWKNFQYIAERVATLNRAADQTIWDNICLGTDFDGVIHPLDEFRTYEDMPKLEDFLLSKIKDYMQTPPANFLPQDKLPPEEILAKLCFKNLVAFVKKNFI